MKKIDLEHCFNNQVSCQRHSDHRPQLNGGLWSECCGQMTVSRGLKAVDYKERDL